MPDPTIDLKNIVDIYIRQNFKALDEYFKANNQLLGFNHIEYEAAAASANIKIAHGLSVTPKDLILTRIVGAGTITFNYASFDNQYIDVSFSGPVRFRAFVGTYFSDSSTTKETASQTQQAKAAV